MIALSVRARSCHRSATRAQLHLTGLCHLSVNGDVDVSDLTWENTDQAVGACIVSQATSDRYVQLKQRHVHVPAGRCTMPRGTGALRHQYIRFGIGLSRNWVVHDDPCVHGLSC